MVTAVASVAAAKIASDASGDASDAQQEGIQAGQKVSKRQAALARSNIKRSSSRALGNIKRSTRKAINVLDPGTAQLQLEALSGASGPEAQTQAFQAFQDSPEQAFLRGQGEQGLLRNQAAIGGLGGGNVRRELQRQAIGLASQDFSNRFNRLGAVQGIQSQRQANVSNLISNRGQQLANIKTNRGINLANIRTGQGTQQANLAGQRGVAEGQAAFNKGQDILNIGSSLLSGVDFGGSGGEPPLPPRGGRGFGSGGL